LFLSSIFKFGFLEIGDGVENGWRRSRMGRRFGEQKEEERGEKRVYFMSTTICEDRLSSHAMNVGLIEDEGRRLEDREEMEEVEMEMVAYCNVEYKKRLFVAAIWKSAHAYWCK
jgi:hypothetical protein